MRAGQLHPADGAGPADGIFDDSLDMLVLEALVGLMARLEIEYLPVPADPGAAAAEDLAAVEPSP